MWDKNCEIYVKVRNKETQVVYPECYTDPESSLFFKFKSGPLTNEYKKELFKFFEDLKEFEENLDPEDELEIRTNS